MSRAMSTTMERRMDTEKMSHMAKGLVVALLGFMIGRGVIEGISPMIVAYYCCIYESKKRRLINLVIISVGMLSAQSINNLMKYLLILVAISIIGIVSETFFTKKINHLLPIIGGMSTLLVGIGCQLYFKSGQSLLSFLLEGITVIFLAIIFKRGTRFLLDTQNSEVLTKETFLSFALLACAAAMGLLSIQIFQITLIQLLAMNVLLYIGYQYGLEAATIMGVGIGFISLYAKPDGTVESFMLWTLLGISVGLFRELGKVGTAVAYCATFLLLSLVYEPKALDLKTVELLIVTSGLFILIPIQKRIAKTQASSVKDSEIEHMLHYKLNRFSETYAKIASMFTNIKPSQERLTNNEINQLIDQVASKVCSDCSMCTMCWQKDFYNTYKTVYSVLSAVESKGEVLVEDIPKEFYGNCLKVDEFVVMVNRIFEIYKTNLKWENKMIENRALFADQFMNISKIIHELSGSLLESKDEQLEWIKKVEYELGRNHLEYLNIYTQVYHNNRFQVIIEIKDTKDQLFIKELLKAINKVGPYKYQMREVEVIKEQNIKKCIFSEKESYKFVKGYAKVNKSAHQVSGDSFTFLDMESGKDIIALSDGMGSGENALIESKATIEMLEQLLEGGFDIHLAIKTVNTLLGVRNDNQAFATLDISMVDRFTGECCFIKNGAVSTYLKRGHNVELIKTDTLPLGMFKEIDSRSIKKKLKADDLVIMVSDGVSDIDPGENPLCSWLEKEVELIDSLNPQRIAEHLLQAAQDKSGGLAKDDMTVLVFRVWERTG